jgi:undecaprenyl phosphate N,N'-diacetylbacillosamine 1-phosphate transferase
MYGRVIKRWCDVAFSLLLMVSFSWLMLIIVLIYVFTFRFPIFFRQLRIGKDNRPFLMYKFRTLRNASSEQVNERRFWFGDVLRFFALDELPQLWQVLMGQMSLVGPRALPVDYLMRMNEMQRSRHRVRPGITGWAQVNGRHEISWEKKFELDAYYTKHLSLSLDIKIALKTISLLLSFRKDNSLSEKKFEGTSSSPE